MDLTRFADDYWARKDDRVDEERLTLLMSLVPDGADVLVVDGGPGMLAERLRERGHAVRMTDLSSHAVERARAKGLDASQVDTDDDPLPFDDATFSCVVSDSAVEHRYSPQRAIAEAARVLRPGGSFVILTPNIAHWRHRLLLLFGRFPEIADGPSDWCHLRMLTIHEVRKMVRAAGLKPGRVRGFPSLWVKGLYPKVFRAPGVKTVYGFLTRVWPTLFGRDVLLVCHKPA